MAWAAFWVSGVSLTADSVFRVVTCCGSGRSTDVCRGILCPAAPDRRPALRDFPGAQFLELPVFCFSVKARFAVSEAQWKLNMDAC